MAVHGWTHQILPVNTADLEPLHTARQQVVGETVDTGAFATTSTSVVPPDALEDGTQVLPHARAAPLAEAALRPPERPGTKVPPWLLVGAVVVLLVLLAGVVGVLAEQRTSSVAASSTTTPAVASTTTSESTTTSISATTAIATTTTFQTDPAAGSKPPPSVAPSVASPSGTAVAEKAAQASLEAARAQDRPAVEALVGSWVPEVSGKTVGYNPLFKATFGYVDIARAHDDVKTRYGALLIRSEDFTSFLHPGVWVSLVPETFSDSNGALSWCAARGLRSERVCLAKKISRSETTGTTAYLERG